MNYKRTIADVSKLLILRYGIEVDGRMREPQNAREFLAFAQGVREWIAERHEKLLSYTPTGKATIDAGLDYTGHVEVLWLYMNRVAGDSALPPFEPGPYPHGNALAAADRAIAWAKSAMVESVAAKKRRRMTAKEANEKALRLAKADPNFVKQPSCRRWADKIGCSTGLVQSLPFWQETMAKTGRGRKGKGHAPKACSLTKNIEAVVGEDDEGSEAAEIKQNQLIAEQKADSEPSPLEDDPPDSPPRKVRCHKKI
jgi:hypothetical protein